MQLSPLKQRFVLHFGEMGSRWGINRTVGQIYALLYICGRALNADEIALGIVITFLGAFLTRIAIIHFGIRSPRFSV